MNEEYNKNYNEWNESKKLIEQRKLPNDFFFLEGEVWWASLGVNIGHEIDGKNDLFERPIVVIKKINDELLLALPITSSLGGDNYSYGIEYKGKHRTILLSQNRTISGKRLLRLIYRLSGKEFETLQEAMHEMLYSIKAIPSD
jgi:mRNA interferase MazF